MSDLKSLVSKAITTQTHSKGPGHVAAANKLLKRIHKEVGEEQLVKLGPSGFQGLFQTLHPELASYLTYDEAANVLRDYKMKLGYRYNRNTKQWVKVKA